MTKRSQSSFAIAATVLLAVQIHASNLRMWYSSPGANNMTQSLLIGNGRMGAIVPGGVAKDTLVLNDSSLWSGTANLSGGYSLGTGGAFGSYQMFGSLILNLPVQTNPLTSGLGTTPSLNTHSMIFQCLWRIAWPRRGFLGWEWGGKDDGK